MRQRIFATPYNIYNKVCCYGEVLLYIIWSAIYNNKECFSFFPRTGTDERWRWRNTRIPKAVQIYKYFLTYMLTWYLLVNFTQFRVRPMTFCKVKVENIRGPMSVSLSGVSILKTISDGNGFRFYPDFSRDFP